MSIQLLFVNDHFSCTPGYSVKSQMHPYHEIVYYGSDCSGKTTIGNEEHEFSSNYIAVNRTATIHSEIHYSHGFVRYICFKSDNFNIESGVYKNSNNLDPLFDDLYDELNNKPPNYKNMIYHKLNELFICINRLNLTRHESENPLLSIKKFIGENCAEKINMHELATTFGYSDSNFRLLFTKKFGISPRDYLIKKRCQKAIELLKFTDLTCADIANQCGFYDSAQFTKIIKAMHSTTPLKIRNQKTC